MDKIREEYYDLEDFIEELQGLARDYKGKVDNDYLEQIDALWCEALNHKDELEPIVQRIENEEDRELENEFYREAI